MSLPNPIPVILCGKTTAIGKPVSEFLLPEYEVIHFIQSYEAAQSEIPQVLAGHDPQTRTPIGTHNYSRPARAVILGRAFTPEQVEEVRKLCKGSAKDAVAWLVSDPANAPGNGPPGPAYAAVVANDVKRVLASWINEGNQRDGIVWY
ncbi:hypothetical protein V1509DRAFT_642781 [Lipomyces kononenkoae]